MEYSANLDNVSLQLFEIVGALNLKNRCCADRPVIITKTRNHNVYSCQCECGGWCTTGCDDIEGAISEWRKMR